MSACQVSVKTTQLVQTMSMATSATVLRDSMEQIVKTVSSTNATLSFFLELDMQGWVLEFVHKSDIWVCFLLLKVKDTLLMLIDI